MRHRLIPALVFARMDGRSNKWLSDRLAEKGFTLTGSAISNYRLGVRQPEYSTLEAVNAILSIRATSVRTSQALDKLKASMGEQPHCYHQNPL
tara:strand:+ start:3189 stop:3467 length:279 start_codon:yes stop_codon:yes gene_type:complete